MPMTSVELLASLRVLRAMARADGVLHPEEWRALEEAIAQAGLEGVTMKTLFDGEVDVNAELSKLESEDAKRATYQSAYALAHADHTCTPEEEALLELIAERLGIAEHDRSLVRRVLDEAADTVLPSHIAAIVDEEQRGRAIAEDTIKYSLLAAALGAFPIPGIAIATDLAVTALQTKLVRDVAQYFGRSLDAKQAGELLAGAGIGMGIRIALTNLAKFIPGYGSVVGAASAFVSTYALGTVATRWFERGGKDTSTLRDELDAAKKEAKKAYEAKKGDVAAKQKETQAALEALGKALADGSITQAEYEKRVADLA
jgi:uncharacterized protein (DUF697 family)/uncharacterized tellurite resistance protein B-like protein